MNKTPLPPPTSIALVVCDNVYQESGGKRALVGLFNQVFSTEFPAHHHKVCVFVSITSLRPGTICKLDIVNAETDAAVVSVQGPLPDDQPTTVCDLVFELRNLVFTEPGTYYVRFWGNDHILMQRPMEVLQLSPQGAEEDGNSKT